jgi:hypothetical protein
MKSQSKTKISAKTKISVIVALGTLIILLLGTNVGVLFSILGGLATLLIVKFVLFLLTKTNTSNSDNSKVKLTEEICINIHADVCRARNGYLISENSELAVAMKIDPKQEYFRRIDEIAKQHGISSSKVERIYKRGTKKKWNPEINIAAHF